MAPVGPNVSAALALASNSEIVVATNPINNTRMMLYRKQFLRSIVLSPICASPGAPSTSLAALGYLDFRKACLPGPVADILIPGPISGSGGASLHIRMPTTQCEPEVISAHTLQCGSAIPRAAHLTREPFGRVGV